MGKFGEEPWESDAICTGGCRRIAEKRSKNRLKPGPNIRCRARREVWNDEWRGRKKLSGWRISRGGAYNSRWEEEEEWPVYGSILFLSRFLSLSPALPLQRLAPEGAGSH